MGEKVVLAAEERTLLGKKVKQLRKEGFVPGVMYGHDVPATAIMAKVVEATKAWRAAGKHRPIELTVGGKKRLAMVKSADVDPVKHSLRHLSLHLIKQNEKVDAEIPVKVKGEGETPAEKLGLVVLQALESIEVQALPAKLPEILEVPGDKLAEPGDHVTVADVLPVDGVEIKTEPEVVVASVYEPSAIAAQNEEAETPETEEAEAEEGAAEGEAAPENPEESEK